EGRRRRRGGEHAATAEALLLHGRTLVRLGRAAEAEPRLRESLAISRKRSDDAAVRAAQGDLGECLVGLGKYAEAEPLLVQAYEGLGAGADQGRRAEAGGRVVRLYEAGGKAERAAEWRGEGGGGGGGGQDAGGR